MTKSLALGLGGNQTSAERLNIYLHPSNLQAPHQWEELHGRSLVGPLALSQARLPLFQFS